MRVEERQIICHGCDYRRGASAYKVVCGEDGRDIIEHAAADSCPRERFVAVNLPATARVEQKACVKKGTAAVPRPWPLRVRAVAIWRRPADAGVGDTLRRLIGPIGITFEEAYAWIVGRPCNCGDRRAKLNRMYPYAGEDRAAKAAV